VLSIACLLVSDPFVLIFWIWQNGYMWIFPVPDDDLSVEKGDGTLNEYEFGKKELTHMVNEFAILSRIRIIRILI